MSEKPILQACAEHVLAYNRSRARNVTQKPILMTQPNIVAIDEGRKTMTRRQTGLKEINKSPAEWELTCFKNNVAMFYRLNTWISVDVKAPYAVGDELWMKEPHYRYGQWVKNGLTKKTKKQAWMFKPIKSNASTWRMNDYYFPDQLPQHFIAMTGSGCHNEGWHKRSTLFMPKKFARKCLKMTNVKAPERVQDISEEDAIMEGVGPAEYEWCEPANDNVLVITAWEKFQKLWNSIHGDGAWDKNEWVWPIEFEKIEHSA